MDLTRGFTGRSLSLMACALVTVAAPVSVLTPASAAEPHVHTAEKAIEIGTLHGKMKYDVEMFQVDPGQRVKLTFKNSDEMQHNLLICKPVKGITMAVAQKAWALGAEAVKKQYVPDDPNILFHTKIVDPNQSDTITFEAPKEAGDYPYVCTLPGHAFLMKGVMRVGNVASGLRDLEYNYFEGRWSELPNFSTLTPKKSAKVPNNIIDISVADRKDRYAFIFNAKLDVPQDGEYTFFVNSDDGSRLSINNEALITYDGIHPADDTKSGKINLKKGTHAFRVEYFEGDGGEELQVAWAGPTFSRVALSAAAGGAAVDHKHHLHVADKPLVIRAFVAGGPARSISVGLPGGINYCFDAGQGQVAFGWAGGFLDVGPDRGRNENDRGGGWCKILGERFEVGTNGFPIRFGDPAKVPAVKFGGYRRVGTPEFYLTADGVNITQVVTAAPSGTGLQYEFTLDRVPGDVYFVLNPEHLKLAASAGTWEGGTLKVPAAQAKKFTVTVTQH